MAKRVREASVLGVYMQMNEKKPVAAPRELKAWTPPALSRMNAGAAELNVTGDSDGPNQVS
jgi:hypothetical protein